MVITRRIIRLWLIFFFPFFIFKYYLAYLADERYQKVYTIPLQNHVGEKFDIDKFIDANGENINLDFTRSEITIVDFWFSDCLPCLQEMKQFKTLITGKDKEIRIISISINSYTEWKRVLNSSSKKFSFLSAPISNWEHLVMRSTEDPKLNNEISGENIETLSNRFQSNNFPMYFVVDKTGTIIASPFSAVEFIKNKLYKQSKIMQFFTNKRTWSRLYSIIFSSLVQYSGYYWLLILIIGGLRSLRRSYGLKRSVNNEPRI
jgi:cytochrome oxidase Cu insertion factor (SCO1/SenC/PrrC family)